MGDKRAVILDKVTSNSGRMLSTILIGNNIVNMTISSLATTLTIRLFGNMYVGIATGIATILVLIFGEITPKTMATVQAEKIALSYARSIYALMIVLTPVAFVINKLSQLVFRLLRIDSLSLIHI